MEEIEYFSKDELEKILKTTENKKHRLQIVIMADAGLRVSEMLGLKWTDCNFQKRSLSIRTLKKRDGSDNLKRVVPMSSRLYEMFYEVLDSNKGVELKGYLFPGTNSEKPVTRQAVYRMLKRIESTEPELSDIHPHKLRHSFATHMVQSGVELHDLKGLLGHEKLETTTIYTHADHDLIRAKMDGRKKKTLWISFKELFIKTQRPKIINLTISDKNFVVGRNDEIKLIQEHMNKGIHVILTGAIGVGKSHLLEHLEFGQKKILQLDGVKDFKKAIINLLLMLFDDDKDTLAQMILGSRDKSKWEKKLQTDSLTSLIIYLKGIVNKGEYILKIDNIDDLTPTVAKALDEIKSHFQIITTARSVKPEHTAFMWNFERVEIKTLDRTNSLRLFHKLCDDLDFDNVEFTRNRVFDTSEGNPKIIVELCERFRKEPVLTGNVVDDITANYLGRQVKERDLSLYLFIVFAGLTIMKFVGRDSGDRDMRLVGSLMMIILTFGRFFFNNTRRKTI